MDVSVELHCDKCGSANLAFPSHATADEIACNDCGERHGTVAALGEQLLACARERSAQALREAIGKLR